MRASVTLIPTQLLPGGAMLAWSPHTTLHSQCGARASHTIHNINVQTVHLDITTNTLYFEFEKASNSSEN